MKVRSDFVTNSSSSSFIIAKKNNATNKDLKELFSNYREEILDMLMNHDGDIPCENNEVILDYFEKKDYTRAVDLVIEELIYCVQEIKNGLSLDDWTVMSEYINDSYSYAEYGELLYYILYYFCDIDSDWLKIKEFS